LVGLQNASPEEICNSEIFRRKRNIRAGSIFLLLVACAGDCCGDGGMGDANATSQNKPKRASLFRLALFLAEASVVQFCQWSLLGSTIENALMTL